MGFPSPIVSVVVANYNGGAFLADALHSAMRQTLKEIEIILVDDASTDGSPAVARGLARSDPRIHVIALEANSGPSVARNAGLAVARGRWLAVLDSDDMMHPDRLEALVGEAERSKAQICADDLIVFQDGARPERLLPKAYRTPRWLSPSEFVLSNRIFVATPPLGYLKPVVDLDFMRRYGIRYRPTLRIGEDYDLILQLLARGAGYRLTGELGYFYRKHSSSISHRLSAADLEQLLHADALSRASLDATDQRLKRVSEIRRRSLQRALSFIHLVSALKSGNWARAAELAVKHPQALPLLRMPIAARLGRLLPKPDRSRRGAGKWACLISRQRVVGSTNGSSAYLLSLCEALRKHGYRISLIQPTPATFGRWPFLYFRSETDVFEDVSVRGSIRIGRRLFLNRNPRILLKAALTLAERLLLKARLLRQRWVEPEPYAVAVPWSGDDQLFIAQHAPPSSRVVIADYAFLTPGIPYALCPKAHSLVLMHDLFSSRSGQFAGLNVADSVASIDEETELALLSRADAVVAIQANEAHFISANIPHQRVILAPMAASTVDEPQPGDDRTVLFVGSNTAPNVVGLQWFLNEVWPDIRGALPGCKLVVAGSVHQCFSKGPDGVRFTGPVDNLDSLYRTAGVVICPLIVGSGLKIKLIEALGRGKAIVATPVTIEGVEDLVRSCVAVTDVGGDFGRAIVRLLEDDELRLRKCREALDVAKRCFSAEACYSELIRYLEQPLRD